MGSTLRLGISPGEGDGNPLQYSCLGNPIDRRARRATVHGVAKSQTRLSDSYTHTHTHTHTHTLIFYYHLPSGHVVLTSGVSISSNMYNIAVTSHRIALEISQLKHMQFVTWWVLFSINSAIPII